MTMITRSTTITTMAMSTFATMDIGKMIVMISTTYSAAASTTRLREQERAGPSARMSDLRARMSRAT